MPPLITDWPVLMSSFILCGGSSSARSVSGSSVPTNTQVRGYPTGLPFMIVWLSDDPTMNMPSVLSSLLSRPNQSSTVPIAAR